MSFHPTEQHAKPSHPYQGLSQYGKCRALLSFSNKNQDPKTGASRLKKELNDTQLRSTAAEKEKE